MEESALLRGSSQRWSPRLRTAAGKLVALLTLFCLHWVPEVVARPTTAMVQKVLPDQYTRSAVEIAPTQVTGESLMAGVEGCAPATSLLPFGKNFTFMDQTSLLGPP